MTDRQDRPTLRRKPGWALRAIAECGAIVAGLLLSADAPAQTVPGCGSLKNSFGPFDYRDPIARDEPLYLVEMAHFTPDVENLVKGNTGYVEGDLDYTLRAFPNHHRALQSVARYFLRGGQTWRNPAIPTADCYFDRALVFTPDDGQVHLIYAGYLAKRGNATGARKHYEAAIALDPDAPEAHYNYGLFLVDQGELDQARKQADIAYAGGYPLPGLRNKIRSAETSE